MNAPDASMVIKHTGAWGASLRAPNQLVGVYDSIRVVDANGNIPLAAWAPDRNWGGSQVAAVCHRVGREMPNYDRVRSKDFTKFSKEVIKRYFEPLTELNYKDTDMWLGESSYSGTRKLDLAALRASTRNVSIYDVIAKCFIKDEVYPTPKNPRGIMSYSDVSKAIVGPIIAACDNATFHGKHTHKWFVKGTDPSQWPERLRDLFGHSTVIETDFSNFEAHQRLFMSEIVHFWLMHMIRDTCSHGVKRLISQMVLGMNVMEFKSIIAIIETRLMSGAMWTSSSNGVLNFLIMSYLTMRSKYPNMDPVSLAKRVDREFVGVFEGDDGLTLNSKIDMKIIEELGIDLKLTRSRAFYEAHFCGITCPMPDPNYDTSIVTDPIEVIRKFFFLPSRYKCSAKRRAQLLRAKAMSYLYLYQDVPVIGELCHKVCEITRRYADGYIHAIASETNSWYRNYVSKGDEKYRNENRRPPNTRHMDEAHPMRLCVWKHFGICPTRQIEMERQIQCAQGPCIHLDMDEFITDADLNHRKFELYAPLPLKHSNIWTGDMSVLPVTLNPKSEMLKKKTLRKLREAGRMFGTVDIIPDHSAFGHLRRAGQEAPATRSTTSR